MALVPEKTYMQWFQEDHFMKKNFNYIFQNPLWNKNIPGGFSLCPYFWMSNILGFLILRCIVVPIAKLTGLVCKTFLGKPDKFFRKQLLKVVQHAQKKYPNNTLLGLLEELMDEIPGGSYQCMILLLLFITFFTVASACTTHVLMGIWVAGSYGPFYAIAIPVGIILVCAVKSYYDKTYLDEDRCKVEYYFWAYLVMFVSVSLYAVRTKLWEVTCEICSTFWAGLGYIFAVIWEFIVAVFATSPSWCAVPWSVLIVGTFVGLALVAYLYDKYAPAPTIKNIKVPRDDTSNWQKRKYFVYSCYDYSYNFRELVYDAIEKITKDSCWRTSIVQNSSEFTNLILRRYSEEMFNDASELVNEDFSLNIFKKWNDLCMPGYVNKDLHQKFMDTVMYKEKVPKKLKKAYKHIILEEYNFQVAERKRMKELEEYRRQRKESRDNMCKKCTETVYAPFKFIGTVIVYTWDVLKSKKKGVCPYIIFPGEKTEETKNEN